MKLWRELRMRASVLVFGTLVAACAPAAGNTAREPVPCRDSTYLRLKATAPDSLSEREFARLHDLERSCSEARMATHGRMAGMHGSMWWMLAMPAMMAMGVLMWAMMR